MLKRLGRSKDVLVMFCVSWDVNTGKDTGPYYSKTWPPVLTKQPVLSKPIFIRIKANALKGTCIQQAPVLIKHILNIPEVLV